MGVVLYKNFPKGLKRGERKELPPSAWRGEREEHVEEHVLGCSIDAEVGRKALVWDSG